MDEVTKAELKSEKLKLEVDLHKENVDFINYAYQKSLQYWKSTALKSVSEKWGEEIDRVSTKESDFG